MLCCGVWIYFSRGLRKVPDLLTRADFVRFSGLISLWGFIFVLLCQMQ